MAEPVERDLIGLEMNLNVALGYVLEDLNDLARHSRVKGRKAEETFTRMYTDIEHMKKELKEFNADHPR